MYWYYSTIMKSSDFQLEHGSEKVLITAALPYPNWPLHIGHVAWVHLPWDIYYRFSKMMWRDALMLCWTDDHGVWIELAAKKEWISEIELTEKYKERIRVALEEIAIRYDVFSKTHSRVHQALSQDFFTRLQELGYIEKREHSQSYCNDCRKFLPDRYIEGTCPYCDNPKARWDQCESCSKLLNPQDLINPVCKMCEGHNISTEETYQYFFKLSQFETKLKEWLDTKGDWKSNVRSTAINKWLEEWLEDRSISRDITWWIPIPWDEKKKMYVWFEAPLWYISFLMEYAQSIGKEDLWKEFWDRNANSRIVHFIGKDNIVFHTIIWPAMLMAEWQYKLPTTVPWNEFVNLEWKKISTSRNHAVWLHDMTRRFNPDVIRYYLAHCIPESKDSNFSWQEFIERNNELANSLWNLVHRVLQFSVNKFGGAYGPIDESKLSPMDRDFLDAIIKAKELISQELEGFNFRKALSELMNLMSEGNKYFNDRKVWDVLKLDEEEAKNIIDICIHYLKNLAILMEPFLPFTSEHIRKMLRLEWDFTYSDVNNETFLDSNTVEWVVPLFKKLDLNDISEELKKLWLNSPNE